jgi:6-phosphofructokinase 1
MARKIKRIGVLTGGGDCPGLNAAVRAIVKAGIGVYNWEVYGVESGFEGLIKKRVRPLTLEDVRGIINKGGTILGATRRHDPFQYRDGFGGQARAQDCSRMVLQHASEARLDALAVVGGDGTLTIAERLWRLGLPLIAIPKTIDNDLSGTDAAIGFNTAVTTAMEALDKLHSTAESHHRVMVVEVMGNKAGWIALESGLAGGADVILIPEIPFSMRKACDKILARRKHGRPFSIVVVSEGAKAEGAGEIYNDAARRRLGGIGLAVAAEMEKGTGLETRVLVLGHLQRGGSPTAFDRGLASRLGVRALEAIAGRKFGNMVALCQGEVRTVRIRDAIAELHTVDPNGGLASTAEALGVSLGR